MNRARNLAFTVSLALPFVIAIAGLLWINRATAYFRERTGRAFYGLVGYHYSVPEWGFSYHPGGQTIHRWSTIIPGYTTIVVLLLSAGVTIICHRKREWSTVVTIIAAYVIATASFALITAYYDINITGVFI